MISLKERGKNDSIQKYRDAQRNIEKLNKSMSIMNADYVGDTMSLELRNDNKKDKK